VTVSYRLNVHYVSLSISFWTSSIPQLPVGRINRFLKTHVAARQHAGAIAAVYTALMTYLFPAWRH
jgi:hypothetical protein